MTQEESKSVKIGDKVFFLGVPVQVDDIKVVGTEYHPFFKLSPIIKVGKIKLSKITKGEISYVLCDLLQKRAS